MKSVRPETPHGPSSTKARDWLAIRRELRLEELTSAPVFSMRSKLNPSQPLTSLVRYSRCDGFPLRCFRAFLAIAMSRCPEEIDNYSAYLSRVPLRLISMSSREPLIGTSQHLGGSHNANSST